MKVCTGVLGFICDRIQLVLVVYVKVYSHDLGLYVNIYSAGFGLTCESILSRFLILYLKVYSDNLGLTLLYL